METFEFDSLINPFYVDSPDEDGDLQVYIEECSTDIYVSLKEMQRFAHWVLSIKEQDDEAN